jgi:tRNA G18 (ribose-2'-O)-methylase SpoU
MKESSKMKEISSGHNEQFKYWKTLTKAKGLREGEHFLLSGEKLIAETLRDPHWKDQVDFVLFPQGESNLLNSLDSRFKRTILAQPLFAELDVMGTRSALLVIKQPKIESWTPQLPLDGLELLCPFGDPQNLGAMIRTAYAFGAARVIALSEAAHPLLPKSIKASSGAILKIPIYLGPSIKDIQSPAVGLDLKGTPLRSKSWPKNLSLLLGEEGQGIPSSFTGERMTLPMKNPIESLNAAVAAGIVIYQLTSNHY